MSGLAGFCISRTCQTFLLSIHISCLFVSLHFPIKFFCDTVEPLHCEALSFARVKPGMLRSLWSLSCNCGRPNLVGGRFTTPTESRYSPVEGEALVVVFAVTKVRYFVLGCPILVVATDHKPLLGEFRSPLSEISNPRLLCIVEKTLWYKFQGQHIPRKHNGRPDYISRPGNQYLQMLSAAVSCDMSEVEVINNFLITEMMGPLAHNQKRDRWGWRVITS